MSFVSEAVSGSEGRGKVQTAALTGTKAQKCAVESATLPGHVAWLGHGRKMLFLLNFYCVITIDLVVWIEEEIWALEQWERLY